MTDEIQRFAKPQRRNMARRGKYRFRRPKSKYTFIDGSPSLDLPKKNPVLSRKHYYGSTEMLCNPRAGNESSSNHFRSPLRFRVENGEMDKADTEQHFDSVKGSMVHLENPEWQTRWYFKYFLGKLHQNYIGLDVDKNPFVLSICVTEEDNYAVLQYRTILWKRMGSERRCIPYDPGKPLSSKTILQMCYNVKIDKGPKEILVPEIQKELLVLEDQEGSVNFKFGVLFAKQGQTTDDEILSNEKESDTFDNFLKLLGDRILLKGWEKFRGGLDAKSNMTGSTSVHTHYEGHEIMFHVSTLLPFSDDPQQVERKRHIGNDIVNIVFQECESHEKPTFTPYGIRSQFTHIYALVTYSRSEDTYRITVFSEVSVPAFGPPLPSSPVFTNRQEFREFLLVKMINGEKATHLTPTFSKRRHRTLEMLLNNLTNTHLTAEKTKSRRFTNTLSDSTKAKQHKENDRREKFISFGQKLKANLITAEVPTRLVDNSVRMTRSEPWETQCICNYFPTKVICGDSWGERLILGTEEGVFKLEGGTMRQLFDKTVDVKQLFVDEEHGLLVLRADKGRDGKVCVFALSDFEELGSDQSKTKLDCKEHKLEKAKGSHLLAVSDNIGCRSFAVAANKKIQLYQWHNGEGRNIQRVVNYFELVKEVVITESPSLLTLVDCGSKGYTMCVGYRSQFDLIDCGSGKITKLHEIDGASPKNKPNLLPAIDVYEENGPSLLLSYNHTSFAKLLNGENVSSFNFQWNATPQSIVYVFPYILAFTRNTIEIRLVVNGTLVHTLVLPKVHLISAKDDIYFASSQLTISEDQSSDFKRRHTNVKYRNTQQTHAATTSDQQIRIYKMSLNSIQKLSLDRSSQARLPNVRTPLSPFSEVSFDFPNPSSDNGSDSSFEEIPHVSRQSKASVSTHNLSRPFSWAVLDDTSSKLDNEFRELIECHQGEINCI
ncbi:GTPase-activating Rap/Ran-GAP domain-like protein 3 isoform X2 [Dendronephthya gigantea]|uniref:GTPase-activating Rap/Ran-GAP domain-like protein 3 isoform X2 n=1 Tax=Dendronephthya gigantea TaxID=151771 RepID=UPI001069807A|nr:GTPase-activating Rap/Ran-GAP domain-like protein 3 isoform X2 [Dendronephthya gigantea]